MVELAELVLRLLGLALPGEHSSANFFDEFMFQPSGNLRLLHYPPQTSMDELQLGGATPFSPCILPHNQSYNIHRQPAHTLTSVALLSCYKNQPRAGFRSGTHRQKLGFPFQCAKTHSLSTSAICSNSGQGVTIAVHCTESSTEERIIGTALRSSIMAMEIWSSSRLEMRRGARLQSVSILGASCLHRWGRVIRMLRRLCRIV